MLHDSYYTAQEANIQNPERQSIKDLTEHICEIHATYNSYTSFHTNI